LNEYKNAKELSSIAINYWNTGDICTTSAFNISVFIGGTKSKSSTNSFAKLI